MDNNKVMIVGTGNVGASIAYAILNQRTAVNEIILTDIIAKDAEGEAMDLRDALSVAPSYVKIKNGTYKDAKDCDVVVITAGAAQKPEVGMAVRYRSLSGSGSGFRGGFSEAGGGAWMERGTGRLLAADDAFLYGAAGAWI